MPQKPKPYRRHLNSANDLVTTYEEVRAGFVALALERNRRSTPYVAEARALKAAAAQATAPKGLPTIPNLTSSGKKAWHPVAADNTDIEVQLRGLSWSRQGRNRTVIYNLQVPLIKKNVDLCLFDCEPANLDSAKKAPDRYIALGELKGGIDPAGADEHWKTANSALTRIRNAFTKKRLSPKLFFVGAAIENSMASEIWTQLDEGTLSNAANLTGSNQVASLCNWLTSL